MSVHSSLKSPRIRQIESRAHPGQAQASARKKRIRRAIQAQGISRAEYYRREHEKEMAAKASALGMIVEAYVAHLATVAYRDQQSRYSYSRW